MLATAVHVLTVRGDTTVNTSLQERHLVSIFDITYVLIHEAEVKHNKCCVTKRHNIKLI